ncbi:MAG: pantoate--beta-alanine ligase [bacterium]|nr:pantoate--beta-alanine ligase [bacterium]
MKIIHSPKQMQTAMLRLKKQGKRIAFVPTMGALHRGHIELVKRAKKHGEIVVVSIFVNPTQFGPNEDYSKYPRTWKEDCRACKAEGVNFIFNPGKDDMYPAGFDTYVVPDKIATVLEGAARPGHFQGVATVVLKLFNAVQADVALFGKKDLQQTVVIRQMVRDLNIPTKIVIVPTIRDRDQLALSSRNVYLNQLSRSQALTIPQSLGVARKMIESGERSAAKIRNYIKSRLVKEAKATVDYVSVADEDTLVELTKITGRVAISLACRIGGVRLIDNITLKVK